MEHCLIIRYLNGICCRELTIYECVQVRLQRKQMQFLVQVSCQSQVSLSAGLLVYQVFPSISDLVQERAPAPITQYLFTIETRNNSERRNFTNLYLFVELLQKIIELPSDYYNSIHSDHWKVLLVPGVSSILHVRDCKLGELPDQARGGAGPDGSPCHLVPCPHQYLQQRKVSNTKPSTVRWSKAGKQCSEN